ncbi:hypothetical protein CDL15_Pgr017661 [Punica granatum]|uniref:Uncharacterized protein n=1 Tax=Punica granatum TaxID=22663 RepID=A0A218XQY0_PUNGR|nr:hypothetical protein CDL15_Pgr017661 [Punica granatum]
MMSELISRVSQLLRVWNLIKSSESPSALGLRVRAVEPTINEPFNKNSNSRPPRS